MQVVNLLEAKLDLPSPGKSPATTKHALSYRVMAEVAARSMFEGPLTRWENGREDTSGYQLSDPIHPALRGVPEVARQIAEASRETPQPPADAPGYRYWIWTTRKELHASVDVVAILDAISGIMYRLKGTDQPLDLMSRYNEAGRNVRRLVDSLPL